ncbi:MAG: ABC transporter permease subunit [Planctomycetota bacterium]
MLPPIVVAVAAIALLEGIVRVGIVPAFLVPPPTATFRSLTSQGDLWTALGQTALGAGVGFACSALIGTMLAAVLSANVWMRRAFYPYAVFFQTVPLVAIAPLLVVWFGRGVQTTAWAAGIASVFPVIAAGFAGFRSADPALLDLFRLHRASLWQTFFKLRLPSALPKLFVGLRIAAALAAIGAVVGEFITGLGLGGILTIARTQSDYPKVFAALILSSVLGLVLFGSVDLIGGLLLRHWRNA